MTAMHPETPTPTPLSLDELYRIEAFHTIFERAKGLERESAAKDALIAKLRDALDYIEDSAMAMAPFDSYQAALERAKAAAKEALAATPESASQELAALREKVAKWEPLIAKGAEAMGFIRFAAICFELNGPTWNEEPGFTQKLTDALLKRQYLAARVERALAKAAGFDTQ
jgi:hypothetical protein